MLSVYVCLCLYVCCRSWTSKVSQLDKETVTTRLLKEHFKNSLECEPYSQSFSYSMTISFPSPINLSISEGFPQISYSLGLHINEALTLSMNKGLCVPVTQAQGCWEPTGLREETPWVHAFPQAFRKPIEGQARGITEEALDWNPNAHCV